MTKQKIKELTPDQQIAMMKSHPQFDMFLREYASWLEEFHSDIELDFEELFMVLMAAPVEINPKRREAYVQVYWAFKTIFNVRQSWMADLPFSEN